MPRRSLISKVQLKTLLAFPDSEVDIMRYYTLDERDLSIIRRRRGAHNRLGFAIQLCCLRCPGQAITSDLLVPDTVLSYVAKQLCIDTATWLEYAKRDETEALLKHVSPIHWGNINLTGDYLWKLSKSVEKGEFRSLLPFPKA